MEWSAETIELTVDDVVFHTLDNTQNAYFDNEHFVLLNIAMGGELGGPIPDNFSSDIMEIDYVRVYQLQPLSSGGIDKQNIEVNIYPNPSKGMFNIEASEIIKKVMVYDLMGRPLLQYSPFNAKTSVSLNQPPGVYLIEVTGDKLEKVNKLIVN
jgi:beta-glucanase (GH16 family)